MIAAGTTAVRALESVAFEDEEGMPRIKSFLGEINLYIFPRYKFKIVDCLITNFHTFLSTNLIDALPPKSLKSPFKYKKVLKPILLIFLKPLGRGV